LKFPEQIYTIGHSTRPIKDFIFLLKHYDISVLADVRSIPYSRRNPHFNKERLLENLFSEGIQYIHIPELGGKREMKTQDNKKLRNKILRGFAEHLNTDEFTEGIKILNEEAINYKTAFMCAEADWRKCHRSVISDYLALNNVKIIHIINNEHSEKHILNEGAKLLDGMLTYDNSDKDLF
jgi:uncharacterized protein (DUF488 family)